MTTDHHLFATLQGRKRPPEAFNPGPRSISWKMLGPIALSLLVAGVQWDQSHGAVARTCAPSGADAPRGGGAGALGPGPGWTAAPYANPGPGVNGNPTANVSLAHVDVALLSSPSF